MTPKSFLAGMVRLETFFRAKLEGSDRRVYQETLSLLDDAAWEALVVHAERVWKAQGRIPTPGQFLEWAGVEVETPAQAAQRTTFEGEPVVAGQPLEKAIESAQKSGVGPVPGSFWRTRGEQLAYECAAEEVLAASPLPRDANGKVTLQPDWIMSRVELISRNAQAAIKKMEAMR